MIAACTAGKGGQGRLNKPRKTQHFAPPPRNPKITRYTVASTCEACSTQCPMQQIIV